jgi:hypothetical protein
MPIVGFVTSPAVKLSPKARKRVREILGGGVPLSVGPVGDPQAAAIAAQAMKT